MIAGVIEPEGYASGFEQKHFRPERLQAQEVRRGITANGQLNKKLAFRLVSVAQRGMQQSPDNFLYGEA